MYKTGKNNNRRCVGPFKTFGLTFLGSSEAQISNIQIHNTLIKIKYFRLKSIYTYIINYHGRRYLLLYVCMYKINKVNCHVIIV